MKLYKLFSVFFFSLFIFCNTFSFTSAASTCPGVPGTITLNWSSSGADTCHVVGGGDIGCGVDSYLLSSSVTLTNVTPGGNCSATISCSGPGGNASMGPVSGSVPVVNGPGCCGTGSQVGLTVWDAGSGTCTAAPTGSWTPSSCPSSCGYGGAWQTCTGGNGLCSGSASYCPATGSCFACTGTAPTGGSFTSTPASTGNYPWTYAASGECTWRCNAGTSKVGNTCVAPSGTISASPNPCLIAEGAASCSTGLTWNTNNPIGMSEITRPVSAHVFWGDTGTASSTSVVAAGYTFYLSNNSATLATVAVIPRCVDENYWTGSVCSPCMHGGCNGTGGSVSTPLGGLTCKNGANNPPFCDQCPANKYWDGNACSDCLNGGCTGTPGGSTTTPTGGLICTNGRTPPSCALVPIVSLTLDGSTNLYLSYYSGVKATIAWNGAAGPVPTSCTIPSGNWSNVAAVAAPYTGSGNTDPLPVGVTSFSYQCSNGAGDSPIIQATATVCPSATPVLTNAGGSCQGTPLAGLTITGNYSAAGVLHPTCTNSQAYRLNKNGVLFMSGATPVPATINLTAADAGTYRLYCDYTSFDGHLFTDPSDRDIIYQTTAPDPIVSLRAAPASIAKGSATVLTWTVMYPNSVQVPPRVPACKLSATPVCTGTCTAAQDTASSTVNAILRTGMTDANDPSGSRLINPNAVDQLPPVHAVDDWRALGKKTINLEKSMDFEIYCGATVNSSAKVRVIVTSTNEG